MLKDKIEKKINFKKEPKKHQSQSMLTLETCDHNYGVLDFF
jgi:hypothetical protein